MLSTATIAALLDEIDKIAAKKEPMYRTSVAAHEIGHARDVEKKQNS